MIKLKFYGYINESSAGGISEKVVKRIVEEDSFDCVIDGDEEYFYEIDDIFHEYGLNLHGFYIEVCDEDDDVLKIINFGYHLNDEHDDMKVVNGIETSQFVVFELVTPYVINHKYILFSESVERGYFGEVEIDEDGFDPQKLLILELNFEEWGRDSLAWKFYHGDNIEQFKDELYDIILDEYNGYDDESEQPNFQLFIKNFLLTDRYIELLKEHNIKELKIDIDPATSHKGIFFTIYKDGEVFKQNF